MKGLSQSVSESVTVEARIPEERETVELGPAGSLTCDEALEEENLVYPGDRYVHNRRSCIPFGRLALKSVMARY